MKRDRESDDEDGDLNHIPPVVVANHSSDRMVGVVEEPRPKRRVRRRSAEAAEAPPDTTPAVSVQGTFSELKFNFFLGGSTSAEPVLYDITCMVLWLGCKPWFSCIWLYQALFNH